MEGASATLYANQHKSKNAHRTVDAPMACYAAITNVTRRQSTPNHRATLQQLRATRNRPMSCQIRTIRSSPPRLKQPLRPSSRHRHNSLKCNQQSSISHRLSPQPNRKLIRFRHLTRRRVIHRPLLRYMLVLACLKIRRHLCRRTHK